jgi:hypothetical protein
VYVVCAWLINAAVSITGKVWAAFLVTFPDTVSLPLLA